MVNVPVEDIATISFIECLVKKDGWWKIESGLPYEQATWRVYKVFQEDRGEVWIVRPDGLRRAWSFRLGAIIHVGQSVLQFNQSDIKEELAIDEDGQVRKPSKPTVV